MVVNLFACHDTALFADFTSNEIN